MSSNPFNKENINTWLQEAVDIFRYSEQAEAQPYRFHFSYQDRDISRFKRLATNGYYMIKESIGKNDYDSRINQYLHSFMRSEDTSTFAQAIGLKTTHSPKQHLPDTALITIGKKAIEHSQKHTTLSLCERFQLPIDGELTPRQIPLKESFQSTFFHELGHGISWNAQRPLEEGAHFGMARLNYSVHTPAPFLNQLTNIVGFIGEPMDRANTPEHIKQLGLNIENYDFYLEQHRQLPVVSEEMFADCFGVIMTSRVPGQTRLLTDMIEDTVGWREQSNHMGASVGLYDREGHKVSGYIGHYTSPALRRLQDVIEERHIDIASLPYAQIVDLCQECRNYGLSALIYELTEHSVGYSKFLKTIPEHMALQDDIFSPDPAVASLRAVNIFDYLTPEDKSNITTKAKISHMVFDSLQLSKKTNAVSLPPSLPFDIQQQQPLLEKFQQAYLQPQTQSLSQKLSEHLKPEKQQIRENSYTRITWDFAKNLVEDTFQKRAIWERQAKLGNVLDKTSIGGARGVALSTLTTPQSTLSLKDKVVNHRHPEPKVEATVARQSIQTSLWSQDPVQQTQTLAQKIQTLARKPLDAVIIAKPTAQKF